MTVFAQLAPQVHGGLRLSLAVTFLYRGLGKLPVVEFAAEFGMPVLLAGILLPAATMPDTRYLRNCPIVV